jgi:hypothetical protein
MKNFTLSTLAFVALGITTTAQKFTILPQVGVENPLTRMSYNNLPSFTPLQSQFSPSLGVRMDYKLKKGYGPYVGISTSRSSVAYSFSNPEMGTSAYTASMGNMQLQLQGGLQLTSKPIYFKKPAAVAPAPVQKVHSSYRSCGSQSYRSVGHCSSKSKQQAYKAPENKNLFVRVMPSAGLALNPFTPSTIASRSEGSNKTYTYNAGNFKTAIVTGLGLEFGSGSKRLFTLNVNYSKALGNSNETLITEVGPKTVTTYLSSKVSGWNASVGIPISLGKKPVMKQAEMQTEKKVYHFRQYRSSCRKVI